MAPVAWHDDKEAKTWVPLDFGTDNPHKCKDGEP
jgi:hypothetical protein